MLTRVRTPEACHRFSDTRSGCGIIFDCGPVVCATLRPPATIQQPFRLSPVATAPGSDVLILTTITTASYDN